MSEADDAAILALVAAMARWRPDLEPLDATLLAAAHRGLIADSRSLAKVFGVAHAHALRALASVEEAGLVAVTRRDARSSRAHYVLTENGFALVGEADMQAPS